MLRICVLVLASLLTISTANVLPVLNSIPCTRSDVSCIFEYVSTSDVARSLYRTGAPAGEGIPSIEIVDPLVLHDITMTLPKFSYDNIIHEATIEGLSAAVTSNFESKSIGEEKVKAKVTQNLNLKLRGNVKQIFKDGPKGDIFTASSFDVVYTNMTVETTFPLTFVADTSGTFAQLGTSSSELILPLKEVVHVIESEEEKQKIKLRTKEEVDYVKAIEKSVVDDFEGAQKAWTQQLVDAMFDKLYTNYANLLKRVPLKQ